MNASEISILAKAARLSKAFPVMHASLKPATNFILLAVWCAVVIAIITLLSPVPWLFIALGLPVGAWAGTLQLHALRETPAVFLKTRTMMDVRDALRSSSSGRLYGRVFWILMLFLLILAIWLQPRRQVSLGILAGYCSFSFARDLLSLRGVFELQSRSHRH